MNTYTNPPRGWGERPGNPLLRLSSDKSALFGRKSWTSGAFAHQKVHAAFCLCSPGRRKRDRCCGPWGFSLGTGPKGEETAAGLKVPALRLNRSAFLRRRKLILWVDFRRRSDGLRHEPTLRYEVWGNPQRQGNGCRAEARRYTEIQRCTSGVYCAHSCGRKP